jgi:hypothetical protein
MVTQWEGRVEEHLTGYESLPKFGSRRSGYERSGMRVGRKKTQRQSQTLMPLILPNQTHLLVFPQ